MYSYGFAVQHSNKLFEVYSICLDKFSESCDHRTCNLTKHCSVDDASCIAENSLELYGGPGSSVGIATGYGLEGPGIESRWREIFRTSPDRPWGQPSLLYNGYRVFPGGKERPGRDADPSPPSSAVGHERVELYLHSSYGPYGLYRISMPV
jgi:hypothetical protein